MNEQVTQALSILEQVVDASTGAGVFKKATEVAMIAQAFSIVTQALTPSEDSAEGAPKKMTKK